jgi:hypothetical protein
LAISGALVRLLRSQSDASIPSSKSVPDRTDAARILAALIKDMPGVFAIDTTTEAAALREETSGSDI